MLHLGLAQRARGMEVLLGCPEPPAGSDRSLAAEAWAVGLHPSLWLERARGVRLFQDARDVRQLQDLFRSRGIDVVHSWHTRDHLLALRAVGRASRPVVIRAYPRAERIPRTPWNRWLFGARTAGLLCVSPETARRNAALRRGAPLRGSFGAVDLVRFRPLASQADRARVRAALGLAPRHRVLGIVARVQPQRRFDLLLAAARTLFRRDPDARLLVVGRGTRRRELAEQPARRLGIAERVVFAGYRRSDYVEVLQAMDLFTFLVPGSDGTCRALLEAAACGIPAVTSRRGALPEIVQHGVTGLLVEEAAEPLAAAWAQLLGNPSQRLQLGAAARRRAEKYFAPAQLDECVAALYEEALHRT